ncbi:MAG TPA: hypothetical protein VHE35_17740, partial [Kofleriaceae bacterium]|nr:hypothetical protein [Kofleriaceae bacterium]
ESHRLDLGHDALKAHDWQRALDLADEHRALHANTQLSLEFENIAIRALVGLGRLDDARVRLDAMKAAYPHSLYEDSLERLLRSAGPR